MKIELLDKNHDRKGFSCGVQELDDYLKSYASQDAKKNLARIFLALEQNKVIGYYSLSSTSFAKATMPESYKARIPYIDVPAILIGRLAVDASCHGQGIGKILLIDAMKRIYEAHKNVFGIHAIVVDAKDENAAKFYEKYGFIRFQSFKHKMFISMKVVETLMNPDY